MTHKFRMVFAAALFLGSAIQSATAAFIQEPLRIPISASVSLEALLVRPDEPGRYPLALITHGSPRTTTDRPNMTPLAMLPQALEFARRGWAAVVVMRQGYGASGGGWAETYGTCAEPDYVAAGTAGAADLRMAAKFLARRPDIDGSHTVAIGVSAGGFAIVALTADPPAGLVAAINFAGGRGSLEDFQTCREDRLVEAYRVFGTRSRIPMLWVYAENDHFFGPKLAQEFRKVFVGSGGIVDFVAAPEFGTDGHGLFSATGIPVWSGSVDAFLKQQNLVMRTTPLPIPQPALTVPKTLSDNGRKAFAAYLIEPPHKAFVLSADGHFGWRSGQRTIEAAKAGALKLCQQSGETCEVGFVDDAVAQSKN